MIKVQNVYYMLSYAFQVLNEKGYRKVNTEQFDNTAELFSAILLRGVHSQLVKGIQKNYMLENEDLSVIRGKLNISETMRIYKMKNLVSCSYDEFTPNTVMNRIIKSIFLVLLKSDISKKRKKEIRNILLYFNEVNTIDLHRVNWNFQYNRTNETYRMLIAICYLTVKGLLQTQTDGSIKMMDFLDDQKLHHLYEKFILEYYRKEHPELKVSSSQVKWQLDDEVDDLLPKMQTDIMIEKGNKILIIDAKYYHSPLQMRFQTPTVHSGNLYQIFTYVKNKEYELKDIDHSVSGLLLYAGTDDEDQPDVTYQMSGNKIGVETLNLNTDFSDISAHLEQIIERFF